MQLLGYRKIFSAMNKQDEILKYISGKKGQVASSKEIYENITVTCYHNGKKYSSETLSRMVKNG